MHFNWFTLILQLLNFAVLVWLLQRFLYRPVLRMIDARRATIAQQYAEADQAQCAAQEQLAALESQRAAIANERAEALKSAATEAERQLGLSRAQAQRDAAALLEETRKQLEQERAQLLAEARAAAFELGSQITRRVLAQQPERLRSEAWLEQIEQHLTGLPQAQRNELAGQVASGGVLTVVTALSLDQDSRERWRAHLQSLLAPAVTIEYAVDPALIAGAQLRFPRAILSFSLESALAALRTELQADVKVH